MRSFAAKLVIEPIQTVAEGVFVWPVQWDHAQHSVNYV